MKTHAADEVAAQHDEPVQTPRRPPCQCISCQQGRARTLAYLLPGVDLVERIADILTNGTPAEQAQLKQLLGINE